MVAIVMLATAGRAAGAIVQVTDPTLFANLTGSVTPVDFVAPPGGPGPIDPDVYAPLGLTLSCSAPGCPMFSKQSPAFVDGWGFMVPDNAGVAFNFDLGIHGFAYDAQHYGGQNIAASFFLGGSQVGSIALQWPGGGPDGTYFLGWYTDFAFDRIVLNYALVDNIYFQTVPGPSALGLIGIAAAHGTRRRRR
ncbi:MAG: hypothetical protein U0572_15190 [Phycisphaerales bacterium]